MESQDELKWEFDELDKWVLSDDYAPLLAYGFGETPEEAWLSYWTQVSAILKSIRKRIARHGNEIDKKQERAVLTFVRRYIERVVGLPEGEEREVDRAQ